MPLLDLFSPSEPAVAADKCDAPTFNGAAHHGRSRGNVAAPGTLHQPDPPQSEDIKSRQVALILRYVLALRAR